MFTYTSNYYYKSVSGVTYDVELVVQWWMKLLVMIQ